MFRHMIRVEMESSPISDVMVFRHSSESLANTDLGVSQSSRGDSILCLAVNPLKLEIETSVHTGHWNANSNSGFTTSIPVKSDLR